MLPEHLDCFYIDPARRSDSNKRIFAIDECEPDILLMKDQLFSKAPRIIIKISTMADISHTISLLPELKTIHVVALKNECKEILLILERGFDNNGHNVEIICSNIKSEDQCDSFTYNKDEEENSQAQFTPEFKTFLYEPNSAILKAGAFKSIGNSFGLSKIGPSSHLYTSGNLHEEFPGRIFTINEVIPFGSKTLKTLKNIYPKANITVRNFPLSVEDIRKRSGVKDGGDIYIFATTLGNNDKYLLVTSKIN